MEPALSGLRVLDLTRTLAGPFCTMMLGDMGADVVKVEEPSKGDETRSWTPFWDGVGVHFASFNRNKRSITLNLRHPQAVEVCLKLARDADVMIESYRAGTADRMGIGYEKIKQTNPKVVYCSISGFGRTGPLSDRPGYDLIIQGYGGLMSTTGEAGGGPLRAGYSVVDIFTGMMAYGAITTALLARERSGEGQYLEASLLEGQVANMSYHAVAYLATGQVPVPMGSAHPSLAPYQCFPSADDYFIIGCANDGLWQRLCSAIGCDTLADDPRFRDNTSRVRNRKELNSILMELFKTKPASHWLALIEEGGVPCGPINTIADVLADPQVQARNMLVPVPHPQAPDLKVPAGPMKLYGTPATVRRHPPMLGEHTEEVLGELGYSSDGVLALRRDGAI